MKEHHFSTRVHAALNIKKIKIPYQLELFVDKISDDECDEIIKICEKETRLYSEGPQVKNLVGAQKSDWNILHNENIRNACTPILQRISFMFEMQISPKDQFQLEYDDFWYARYTDNSFIAPHNHQRTLGHYSFCVYLNAPKDGTYLYFMNEAESIPIKFYKGDIVIFPGGLVHWSNDVSKGRKIIAGNLAVQLDRERENG